MPSTVPLTASRPSLAASFTDFASSDDCLADFPISSVVAFISTIELAVCSAKEEKLSMFVATSLIETIISSIADAVSSTNSASVSAMRLTSSMLADISRMDADVSSAFAERSSMLERTLPMDRSIWLTDSEVASVDTSCSPALRASTRDRPLVCWLTAATSAASWPNRRIVRSRLETRARSAAAIRSDRVAATISRAESDRSPAATRSRNVMA